MNYFYIVYQRKNGEGWGSLVTYSEREFSVTYAHKAAEIACDGLAVVMNWKTITESEYHEFSMFMNRAIETDGDHVQ